MRTLMLYLVLLVSCLACNKVEERISNVEKKTSCVNDLFPEYQILTEEETAKACIRIDVYRYNEAIYYTNACCNCRLIPVAYQCDGAKICENDGDCMNAFYENAEYMYSIKE